MTGKLMEVALKPTPPKESIEETNRIKDDDDYALCENPEKCMKYIQELRDELSKEQMEKAAVALERDKLKVCWEMTMEQLADIREELMSKIDKLQRELTSQVKRKRVLQRLLQEHGKTIQELKELAELFFEKNNSLMMANKNREANPQITEVTE